MLNWKFVLTFELRVNDKEVADVWHKLLQKIEMFWKENLTCCLLYCHSEVIMQNEAN